MIGTKLDAQKPRMTLLPKGALASIVAVLEFGAKRYGVGNWQHVAEARTRYFDAAQRHLWAWWDGTRVDSDSGLPHLAHAACSLLFLLWFDAQEKTP